MAADWTNRLIRNLFAPSVLAAILACFSAPAQESTTSAKPSERVLGTVLAVDQATHNITVKEDKTGTEYTVQLENTRTLLKVEPGAKNLSNATRITAGDLAQGDRVQVGGSKAEDKPDTIVARSLILMSGRELQQAHQAEAAAWQHSTAGVVTSVDPGANKISINMRTPEGTKPVLIDASNAQFTRYSPESPQSPAKSQLAEIQPEDHVMVIGEKSADGSTISAQKIYSGAFRTVNGTVVSISPDGKQVTVKNLATNKPLEIALTDNSAVRKLPPMLAMGLARRFNPNFRPVQNGSEVGGNSGAAGGSARGAPPQGLPQSQSSGAGNPRGAAGEWQGQGGPSGMRAAGNGDISQLIERVPKISISDLKPGDAVVISGVATGSNSSKLVATNIIAGVEPILQSAPRRQGEQAMGGDWGLGEMSIPQ